MGRKRRPFFYCEAPGDPFFYVGGDRDIPKTLRRTHSTRSGYREKDPQSVNGYASFSQHIADPGSAPAEFLNAMRVSAIGIGHSQE